jgi:hypothetical protein
MKTMYMTKDELLNFIAGNDDDWTIRDNRMKKVFGNLHYTNYDTIYNNAPVARYIVLLTDNDEIIGITKVWERLDAEYRTENAHMGFCLNYIELAKSFQHQGLLSELVKVSVDEITKRTDLFLSNSESEEGRAAHVNDHFAKAFKNTGVKFFASEHEYYDSLREASAK